MLKRGPGLRLLTPYIKRLIYSKKLVESKYFPNSINHPFFLYEQMNYKKTKEIRELYLHLRNIPYKTYSAQPLCIM